MTDEERKAKYWADKEARKNKPKIDTEALAAALFSRLHVPCVQTGRIKRYGAPNKNRS